MSFLHELVNDKNKAKLFLKEYEENIKSDNKKSFKEIFGKVTTSGVMTDKQY